MENLVVSFIKVNLNGKQYKKLKKFEGLLISKKRRGNYLM